MLLNKTRLENIMAHHGIDVLVASSPENVTYMSGYWALSQWIRRGPQTYVVWPTPDLGEPCIITSASLLDLVSDQEVSVNNVVKFGDFVIEVGGDENLDELGRSQRKLLQLPTQESALDALTKVLDSYNLNTGRIAIDEGGLLPTLDKFNLHTKSDFEIIPGFELLREVRMIKTEDEISRLRSIAQITEKSIDAALSVANVGVSELEMAEAFNVETIRQGGLPVLFCIGTGQRSAMPNVQPSNRKLEDGDIIRFDVGGRYQHYRADIARIAVLGSADEKIKKYYHALWCGVQRGIEKAKPGQCISELFSAVIDTVHKEGIPHYARTHVGHGIGIDGYDLPNLTLANKMRIEEGMVLCIETPYYELGFGGLQVEDMIVVRSDGAETLMTDSGELRVI